jgi:asparagine synthase (glutamine-hydrolysing)
MPWLLVGRFLTEPDPAAIVEAFLERSDVTLLHDAGGEFWLVVRDPRLDVTNIFRDRTGVLPLVYAPSVRGLLISTSLQSAVSALRTAPRPNPAVFDDWPSFRRTFAPDVPFEGIRSLSGEHALCVENERIREVLLPLPTPPAARYRTLVEAAESLGQALSGAVRRRVERPGRLGALLSGGTDSSLVTALVREHFSGPLHTLFVTFDDNPRDYGHYAAEVANRFGTEHQALQISADTFAAEWPRTVKKLATPVPMPCHVGFSAAMNHLAGLVDTMIDGDGADTVFGGSLWPQGIALSAFGSFMPAVLRRRLRDWSHQCGATTAQRMMAMGLQALGTPFREYPHVSAAMVGESTHQRVFRRGNWAGGIERRTSFASGGRFSDGLFSCLMLHSMPESIATAVRLAMDQGILFTYPFLDYEVLQASQRLPLRMRYHYRYRKLPLRTFARKYFSHDFLFKPKEGFGVPLGKWFGQKRFAPILGLALEERSLRREWWKEHEVRKVMQQHMVGAGSDSSAETMPWIIANLELWARICLESDDPALYA